MPTDNPPPSTASRRHFLALTAGGGLATLALSGCAAFNYGEADAPIALPAVQAFDPRPDIALVLGPGGPRGYAHIGVMRVLEEAGIRPDVIVGTSVGALLGVLWASGLSAAQIDERSLQGGPLTVFDPSPFADRGWIHGQRLQDYVNAGLNGRRLQDLPRRVIVVATRRYDKTPRFFTTGNAGVAVRASAAVPGIISPVGIAGVEYEDGDESLPLAVSAARASGARFIIAVNVYARPESTPVDVSAALRARDVLRRARIDREVAKADFLLHPDVGYHASALRGFSVECRRIGEATARARLPALRERLGRSL
ncbi:MAG: patatin-like phospholipase family protein [Rubrivivax sp.]|nr:patatin-like phospholipase family protein [Rubrivivax sp.]